MHRKLVSDIKNAQEWLANNEFPRNQHTLAMRNSKTIDNFGQILPNVHRSSNDLCDLISATIVTNKLKSLLEIGTLFGYSTLHLAEAAGYVNGHLDSIDLRVAERKWMNGETVKNIHLLAEKYIKDAGLSDHITLWSGRSDSIMSQFVMEGRSYDLIFIDGSHSRYVVTLDLLNSLNLLSDHGFIFMDDVSEGIAVKDFHHGGPNSILPSMIASGRFNIVTLSSNTLVLTRNN